MHIKAYLATQKEEIDRSLLGLIQNGKSYPELLKKSMLYSLEAGGKRIRPILALAACEAVGGRAERAMPAALALEMIHTFSLVHDDLPAMDNDTLRRGKPTNHKVFGEGVAILAGDGLLAEAFYLLVKEGLVLGLGAEMLLEVVQDIAEATGPRGMVGGQILDLEGEEATLGEKDLEKIHRYKTGRLIAISVTSGAKLGGGSEEEVAWLQTYGEKIGLAFQIADDVLNVEGDAEKVGKSVGSDDKNRKSTYPKILGLEASKGKAAELVQEAIRLLKPFGKSGEPLAAVAEYIVERNQ